jgi:hypothetical protein
VYLKTVLQEHQYSFKYFQYCPYENVVSQELAAIYGGSSV